MKIKSILFCLAMMFVMGHSSAETIHSPKVIDGDTIDSGIKPFTNLPSLKIRIAGIDSPEIHGKCQKEKDLAIEAKKFLEITLKDVDVKFDVFGYDKYGGRILAIPYVMDVSIADEMIRRGLAIPYKGQKKTKDWCK